MRRWLERLLAARRAYACLAYHRVLPAGEFAAAVNPAPLVRRAVFRQQMELLLRRCRPVPLAEMVERARTGRPPRGLEVALTFDDGYADVLTVAGPILAEMGIPYTVFVVTGFVDEPDRIPWWDQLGTVIAAGRGHGELPGLASNLVYDLEAPGGRRALYARLAGLIKDDPACSKAILAELTGRLSPPPQPEPRGNRFFSWEQARAAAGGGLASFAPHTVWHVTPADPDFAAQAALSRRRLREELPAALHCFAYPYGVVRDGAGASAAPALAALGFTAAFTTRPGHLRAGQDPMLLPRLSISGRDDMRRFLLKLLWPDGVRLALRLRGHLV